MLYIITSWGRCVAEYQALAIVPLQNISTGMMDGKLLPSKSSVRHMPKAPNVTKNIGPWNTSSHPGAGSS